MYFLKKTLRFTLRLLMYIIIFIGAYALCAWLGSVIPVNKNYKNESEGIAVYIMTNGVHTDLVLPIKNEYKDWSIEVTPLNTKAKDTTAEYIAFGWGDKGFYLDTPSWSELKASTAFKAMFALSTAAMHTTFYKTMNEGSDCKKISVSPETYAKLTAYIDHSFQKGTDEHYKFIAGHSYDNNDCFYEAIGSYNLFHTCNTWANTGLKTAGLRACLWTPADKGIFYQYSN